MTDDATLDLLIERLEQSLGRSTNLVQLIQQRVDESQKAHWERVNEILYSVHKAVSAERSRREAIPE